MPITNPQGLPPALIRAIENDRYDNGGADYSVTTLISPVRKAALWGRYAERIQVDASDRLFALYGQLGHTLLERAAYSSDPMDILMEIVELAGSREDEAEFGALVRAILRRLQPADDIISERRFYLDVNGVLVSGAIDLLGIGGESWGIQDFKFCSVWTHIFGRKTEWDQQLNLYRLLVEEGYWLDRQGNRHHEGRKVEKLGIVALYRDWQKSKSRREKGYPRKGADLIEIPLWSRGQAREYLEERVRLHLEVRQTEDHLLPHCTPDERWERGVSWAVIKQGAKRAKRLFDTESEASDYVVFSIPDEERGEYTVQRRAGISIRCADHCDVAPFCTQWMSM